MLVVLRARHAALTLVEPLPEPTGAAASPDDMLGDRMVRGREGDLQTLTLRFEN